MVGGIFELRIRCQLVLGGRIARLGEAALSAGSFESIIISWRAQTWPSTDCVTKRTSADTHETLRSKNFEETSQHWRFKFLA